MGICQLSPEERVKTSNNKMLKTLLLQKLKDLTMYSFTSKLKALIPNLKNRYMYNEGILEDIQKILHLIQTNTEVKSQSMAIDTFAMEDQLRNSCLIMQDQMYQDQNQQSPHKSFGNIAYSGNNIHENIEFEKNLVQNQSLVCQINIIYQHDFDITKYRNSLKLFLKWSSIFHEHFYGGFLKPIYKQFCKSIYEMQADELETIVDETVIFVQYMVTIYTDIYHLKTINESQNGSLFKNQNVFNLIMANMFKKTKIKIFVRSVIRKRQENKIKKFAEKLKELQGKNLQYFGVETKFRLQQIPKTEKNEEHQNSNLVGKVLIRYQPYSSCLKALQNLCENSQTPITKLKLIVQISKGITSQIYNYYDQLKKETPEIDPDNLTAIIMYLIAKVNKPELYEELKIAQYFTTNNCLNCISGYYLNTFNAAIESLLAL